MAKTAADYKAEGIDRAQSELGFSKNPHCIALLVANGSWQRNAYVAGFNETIGAARSQAVRAHIDAEAEKQAAIAMSEDKPAEYFGNAKPHGIASATSSFNARYAHVAALRADADKEPNPARQARLRGKANNIMARMSRAV